jgi:hypothetical protein
MCTSIVCRTDNSKQKSENIDVEIWHMQNRVGLGGFFGGTFTVSLTFYIFQM